MDKTVKINSQKTSIIEDSQSSPERKPPNKSHNLLKDLEQLNNPIKNMKHEQIDIEK